MHSDRHVIEHLLLATLIKVYTTHYSPHVILAQVPVNDQAPVFQKLGNAIQRLNNRGKSYLKEIEKRASARKGSLYMYRVWRRYHTVKSPNRSIERRYINT